jgi:hypothetical protein
MLYSPVGAVPATAVKASRGEGTPGEKHEDGATSFGNDPTVDSHNCLVKSSTADSRGRSRTSLGKG